MHLLNVRLSPEDAEAIRILRDAGVSIADVTRAALHARADDVRKRAAIDTDALVTAMIARYPRVGRSLRPKPTDRRAVARAIRAKLRK